MRRGLIVAVLLCGCAEAETELPVRGRFPVPGCEAFDHTPCDVRDEPCQVRLHALTGCLRGREAGPLPPITLLSESAYRERLIESFEPRPDPDHFERALVLMGMVEVGALSAENRIDDQVEGVAGFYRYDTDEIVLVDHGQPFDAPSWSILLVHELVHAEQDRDVDLNAFASGGGDSFEARLVRRSITEGEAELHETRYGASAVGLDPSALDLERRFDNMVAQAEQSLLEADSPLLAGSSTYPYAYGGRFTHDYWSKGGRDQLLDYLAEPLASSLSFMALDAAVIAPTAPGAPTPPAGWSVVADEVFGPFGLFVALAVEVGADEAYELALAWRGDAFSVYTPNAGEPYEGATTLVWRIDMNSSSAAAAVATAFDIPGTQGAESQGDRVVVVRTQGGGPLDWAFAE